MNRFRQAALAGYVFLLLGSMGLQASPEGRVRRSVWQDIDDELEQCWQNIAEYMLSAREAFQVLERQIECMYREYANGRSKFLIPVYEEEIYGDFFYDIMIDVQNFLGEIVFYISFHPDFILDTIGEIEIDFDELVAIVHLRGTCVKETEHGVTKSVYQFCVRRALPEPVNPEASSWKYDRATGVLTITFAKLNVPKHVTIPGVII